MTESFVGAQQQGSSTSYRGASSSSGIKQQNVNSNNNNTTSHQRDLSPDRIKKTKTTAATSIMTRAFNWSGKDDFLLAQGKIFGILVIAYIGNVWEPSYNRNENHDMFTFWFMNILIGLVGIYTLKHDATASSRGVQLLSRAQTEEWKGWMQWAFIMYHYYRAYSVYNVIRVFVSAYVWMTGFGNFLYFDKKQDFTIDRAISMWLRINYFPLLLSFGLNVSLENYYVVPLHTTGFFITMATCYVAKLIKQYYPTWSTSGTDNGYWKRNGLAIGICLLVHVIFYETSLVNSLKMFSDEYHFRFQADKYTAWVGIVSGYLWPKLKVYMQWCYNDPVEGENQSQEVLAEKKRAMWIQRVAGVGLIYFWWGMFGHIQDKYTYNPIHPYCFWLPVAGWLMVRNSSKYLTELHSGALEFFGRITLETYVLQFHVFMNHDVKHIPIVVPGSGPDGPWVLKFLNMGLCGILFVTMAYYARKITITTQETVTELVGEIQNKRRGGGSGGGGGSSGSNNNASEMLPLSKLSDDGGDDGNNDDDDNDTHERKTLKPHTSSDSLVPVTHV